MNQHLQHIIDSRTTEVQGIIVDIVRAHDARFFDSDTAEYLMSLVTHAHEYEMSQLTTSRQESALALLSRFTK
jgi:hypothetical protein